MISCTLHFSGILASAQASLDDAVSLKECDSIDLTRISSPNDFIAAASSSETLEQIEEIVTAWIKQIEQVRAYSRKVFSRKRCKLSFWGFEELVLSKKTGEDFRRYVRKGSDTASCLMLSLPTFEVSERV